MKSILYLHGFHSSPMSEKAMIFKRFVEASRPYINVIAPQLPVYPADAKACIDELATQYKGSLIGVVGSSLGGFLSTYIHNQYGLPAVLINPAVRPFELLEDYLGPQVQPITGEAYQLTPEHMLQLKEMYQSKVLRPKSVWLLQQEKDEVLDYRQALEKYQDCHVTFELGGSHAFDGFDRFVDKIVEFFEELPAD